MTWLAIVQAAEAAPSAEGISTGALIFMLTCMGLVTAMTVWSFYRVLTTRKHFDPDGTGPARPPVRGKID
jgi:hypothetical protein